LEHFGGLGGLVHSAKVSYCLAGLLSGCGLSLLSGSLA
jgi:hypothetical protein